MQTNIKIPFALLNGELIHISEVDSGSSHGGTCPECQTILIAKKGSKMRHHFAHQTDIQCNAESALHRIAKTLLFSQIKKKLSAGQQVPVSWKCSQCEDQHQGDLLKKAHSVRLEYIFPECRPDITLFDQNEKPIATIEIIVTHAPEDSVRAFCKERKIGLLEYHVKSDSDLDALRSLDQFNATAGSVCLRKKCPECKSPLHSVVLHVVEGDCWKCNASMKVAFTSCLGVMDGPPAFSPNTLKLARERGAILRERYSNVVRERYVANSCPRCGNFVGEFYLHDYWYGADEENGTLVGYRCFECEWRS